MAKRVQGGGKPRSVRKTAPPRRVKGPSFKRKKIRKWTQVNCIVFLFLVAGLLNLFIGGVLYLFVMLDIPDIQSVAEYHPKMTSRILGSRGELLARFYDENRLVVPLAGMPEFMPRAFVAAEDARFYRHSGVDLWSIFRALVHNIRVGGRAQGGSTITQQVTRSLLLTRKKLYTRKIKEAILAYRIDSRLSKEDILYIYLNQIYLGEGAYGVAAAAETYFGKPVKDLSLAEIAVLAGLPQAPSRYSPFKNMESARRRQAYVLNRMAEEGYITDVEARTAYEQPIVLKEFKPVAGAGYFVQYVRNYMVRKYGEDLLRSGGLTIYTTLDLLVQKNAVAALKKGVPAGSPQGSLVALEMGTGKVRALVGGLDFSQSQFDRATQARRQPGSAMKPIIYAAALQAGFTPDTLVADKPLRLPGSKPGEFWEPRNFDKRYHGPTTLRDGLIHSRNIVAVNILKEVGVAKAIRLARELGITAPLAADLSLALGSSGVSLLELTAAYSAFGSKGRYAEPVFVRKILDRYGKVLEDNPGNFKQVLDGRTAAEMNRILMGVVERGTGRKAGGLGVPVAGKTGTTDRNMDAWFIGYKPDLVAGVWVGNDRKEPLGWGMTGGRVAAPIWRDFMQRTIAGQTGKLP